MRVRRKGYLTWVNVVVDLASANGQSLAVSAESGLAGSEGFGFNRDTGRMQLLLLKRWVEGEYLDLASGDIWEVSPL